MPSCSPIRPAVSESRIKRITQIARITPHRPTTCAFPSRPYPAALRARPRRPTVSESRIKRITRITRITPPPNHRFIVPIHFALRTPCRHSPIPPVPVIRFAHCRLRLCLRGKGERMAFLKVCIQGCFDGFGRMEHAMQIQKPLHTIPRKTFRHSPFLASPIPPAPFPTRKGGAHGFLKGLYPWLF